MPDTIEEAQWCDIPERGFDLLLERGVDFHRQSFAIVRDGSGVFSGDPENRGPILEIQAATGIETDRLGVILEGPVELPQVHKRHGSVVEGGGVFRI